MTVVCIVTEVCMKYINRSVQIRVVLVVKISIKIQMLRLDES